MPPFKDLTGQRFNRWTALRRLPTESEVFWLSRCDCGTVAPVRSGSLITGQSKSCGCLQRERASEAVRQHGYAGTPTYLAWQGAKDRCHNPNNAAWRHYGGRGIVVCERWRNDFSAFLDDMGEKPRGRSLDRIDNNGPYSPENCRWATHQQQMRNTRANRRHLFRGRDMFLSDIAAETGLKAASIERRMREDHETAEVAVRSLLSWKRAVANGASIKPTGSYSFSGDKAREAGRKGAAARWHKIAS